MESSRFIALALPHKNQVIELGLKCWEIALKEAENKTFTDEIVQHIQSAADARTAGLEWQNEQLKKTVPQQIEQAKASMQQQWENEKAVAIKEAILQERLTQQEQILALKIERGHLQSQLTTNDFSQRILDCLEKTQKIEVHTSQELGKMGERQLEELIINCDAKCDIENKASVSHAGDFHISVDNGLAGKMTFLVDAKKYENPVPIREREKLIRDVEQDSTIAGGFMVSLKSTIQNKDHFQLDITKEKKKPILYLCLKDMTVEESQRCLAAAIRILNAIATTHDEDEKEDLLKKLQQTTKDITATIRDVQNMILAQTKQLDALKKHQEQLRKSLYSLQNDEEVEEQEKEKEKDEKPKKKPGRKPKV
jgi:hypothetical protein